jgi:hypothetical protein
MNMMTMHPRANPGARVFSDIREFLGGGGGGRGEGGPGKKGHLGKGISYHVVTYYSFFFSPPFLLGNPIRWGNFCFSHWGQRYVFLFVLNYLIHTLHGHIRVIYIYIYFLIYKICDFPPSNKEKN